MQKVKHIPQYNYEDYKSWKGDWELIDGIPFAMSPSAMGKHQFVASQLSRRIGNQLEDVDCTKQCFLYYELDWIVNNETIVRPDIVVVCGQKVKDFIRSTPTLIVEILSKSTAYNDRIVKKEIYEAQGVKYYLIANPEDKTVETYKLIDGKYQLSENNQFTLNENCKISLQYDGIWE